jgi:hypothetical protein
MKLARTMRKSALSLTLVSLMVDRQRVMQITNLAIDFCYLYLSLKMRRILVDFQRAFDGFWVSRRSLRVKMKWFGRCRCGDITGLGLKCSMSVKRHATSAKAQRKIALTIVFDIRVA